MDLEPQSPSLEPVCSKSIGLLSRQVLALAPEPAGEYNDPLVRLRSCLAVVLRFQGGIHRDCHELSTCFAGRKPRARRFLAQCGCLGCREQLVVCRNRRTNG